MKNKYYVIESVYVGPNVDTEEWLDFDHFEITTDVPVTNMSGKVHLNGWLGTTNDISRHSHGEFVSEEDARRYVESYLQAEHGGWRENECDNPDPAVVAIYSLGAAVPITRDTLWEMIDRDLCERIDAIMTDTRLRHMAYDYACDLKADGYNVSHERVLDVMGDYRDNLDTGED